MCFAAVAVNAGSHWQLPPYGTCGALWGLVHVAQLPPSRYPMSRDALAAPCRRCCTFQRPCSSRFSLAVLPSGAAVRRHVLCPCFCELRLAAGGAHARAVVAPGGGTVFRALWGASGTQPSPCSAETSHDQTCEQVRQCDDACVGLGFFVCPPPQCRGAWCTLCMQRHAPCAVVRCMCVLGAPHLQAG